MVKVEQVVGLCDAGLVNVPAEYCVGSNIYLKPAAVSAFDVLRRAALVEGFDVRIASGYRSFERQLGIWNGKATGERAILGVDEVPLDMKALTDRQVMQAIMLWSAVPGMSRHHWGTDFDIYEANALAGDALQLTVGEAEARFKPFYNWLEGYLDSQESLFRPYDGRGNIAPEPWHLSVKELVCDCQDALTEGALYSFYSNAGACSSLALRDEVLSDFSIIYPSYVSAYFV